MYRYNMNNTIFEQDEFDDEWISEWETQWYHPDYELVRDKVFEEVMNGENYQ